MVAAKEPMAWEIGRIGGLKEAAERLAALKFMKISRRRSIG